MIAVVLYLRQIRNRGRWRARPIFGAPERLLTYSHNIMNIPANGLRSPRRIEIRPKPQASHLLVNTDGPMRYQEGHKEQTRERIVEAASKRFRKQGAHAVGVAGLMADAGLTHGGFYAHFKSKEDLIREAVAAALARTTGGFERVAQNADDGLEAIVRGYLSRKHRDQPEQGCVAASLTPEVARHQKQTRRVFSENISKLISLVEAQLPFADEQLRRQRSIAVFSLLMGTLQLARAEPDSKRSQEILESGIAAALALGRNLAA
jgi:TetR/AcrR family transcriptional regulator, transcriptional repressor for nem operon